MFLSSEVVLWLAFLLRRKDPQTRKALGSKLEQRLSGPFPRRRFLHPFALLLSTKKIHLRGLAKQNAEDKLGDEQFI